ncbi:MAG: 7-carboxy-7-deazaguanine synthase [Hyphococcus sp.]|nr:MAG: 7-carboxy-7-deazaguanine synthase [Marinicaulis sp.]
MSTYSVKELFYTLQGEGAQSGRPAVFLRFAGCNLWSGLEKDRAAAVCTFCDTDFVGVDGPGGGKFKSAEDLAETAARHWPAEAGRKAKPYIVCTGGEPLLQLDRALIDALHKAGFEIAVETNGTIETPEGIDWVCVSPKAEAPVVQTTGQELKLVYPQEKAQPEAFTDLGFDFFFLQPMDGPSLKQNTADAIRYCQKHPQWRLSVQSHKILDIP